MTTKATFDDRLALAVRLKQIRESKGLTQQQLAERARLHPYSISKIEQALREPAWTTALALADALGVSLDAFRADAP